ncbi:Hypothetical protein PHPALM_36195 [Phytophthora palmivora]|uniref:Retrovirus-related Pol polyprotein from transposon TNT 1-94-like beta-barrel domain-containing protein n=1 Tax=Phytophthora palmivora TaxID=4796 RepID=A0A2P4X0L0_9STRA|nr:Hypothetical protein PHPALM_36195 [Phytophthora palmivora]
MNSQTQSAGNNANPEEFDKRDHLARATILKGLRGGRKSEDAAKVSGMTTAHEMWETLVSDNTQTDFSYAVMLRRQLYQCSHQQDQSMAEYLRTMTQLRQQLRNVGSEHAIGDDEMARLPLMGVAISHRELVEQFDLQTRQGNPPTLQQVTNALRSLVVVVEVLAMVAVDVEEVAEKADNKQAKVKTTSKTTDVKATESKKKKETGVIKHMEFLHNGDEDSSDSEDEDIVGMVHSARVSKSSTELMLDSGTTTHVCINRDNFVMQKNSKTAFKVWYGQVTRGVMSGQAVIYAKDESSTGLVKLELSNVEYSPHGSVNLISLGVMEDIGGDVSSTPKGVRP